MQSSNPTQYTVECQPQGASRLFANGHAHTPKPVEVDSKVEVEMRQLMEVERRLAQKYGIASHEVTDSTAVLQEARRRARSPWRRAGSTISAIFAAKKDDEDEDVEKLLRLLHLRCEYDPQSTIPSPIPDVVVDASRFWAVLIAIDAYTQHPLHGCVSDALLMKNFLIDDLGVPKERIQCLLGPNPPAHSNPTSMVPSRTNIIDMLYRLVDNSEIEQGDNIIVYFSGHGSSYRCLQHPYSEQCSNGLCPTKALCPIDRDTKGANGKWIPDISDRELDGIFAQIYHAKGHKITFIADCCHGLSVDGNAEELGEARFMRATNNSSLDDMLHAAHERWQCYPHYRSVFSNNWRADMNSHVLLAACQDQQTAKEVRRPNGYNGVFTKTLVRVLRSTDWKKETTYVDLAKPLNRSPSQTVLVVGERKKERLFYQDDATASHLISSSHGTVPSGTPDA